MMQDKSTPTAPLDTLRDLAVALPTSPVFPCRDAEFYCTDVIFQVEDVLFKVFRRPFEEEPKVFKYMFDLPPRDHPSGLEGASDINPILLEGVEVDEFKSL